MEDKSKALGGGSSLRKFATKFFEAIFHCKNDGIYKVINILGLKFRLKNKHKELLLKLDEQNKVINRLSQHSRKYYHILLTQTSQAMNIYDVHKESFGKYKNYYNGRDLVVFGNGPSLNYYKPLNNVINIGVNLAFLSDKMKLDYLFISEKMCVERYLNELDKVVAKKFYALKINVSSGDTPHTPIHTHIPESYCIRHNAQRYYTIEAYPDDTFLWNNRKHYFTYKIDSQYLIHGHTIIFDPLQFALWTSPRKIYLVGCDAGHAIGKHFYGEDKEWCKYRAKFKKFKNQDDEDKYFNPYRQQVKKCWIMLKEFAQMYYPDTEIISINPVGLKGNFKDIYTQEFADNYLSQEEKKNIEIY
ncbi:MAG: hypothetical protein LBV16_02820 [Elusimicrobiota bacterium]|jgi:hypothetical protein|nr:hypothetical protein [Elusimicrobiota bacterium]